MYFFNTVSSLPVKQSPQTREWLTIRQFVLTALFGAIAALFQSAGGFLPGIGYLISPLATAPIVVAFLVSYRSGVMAYCLTILLLFLIQPSEIFAFPFTTGILGMGLGIGFRLFRRRINIILTGAAFLISGIVVLLYVLKFPVFGPAVSSSFHFSVCTIVTGFSLLYSWVWMEISCQCLKRLHL